MYGIFYSLFAALSSAVLPLIAALHPKTKSFLSARKLSHKPTAGLKRYWVHCASLGEFEMAKPILEKLLNKVSLEEILITFFSPSGYSQAITSEYKEAIMYLPLDSKKNVNSFYSLYQIEKALFIRYDLWYNFISKGLKRNTKFYLINARFGQNHKIFTGMGKPYLNLLVKFNHVFCSDHDSHNLLVKNNLSNSKYTGDSRYDRVKSIATTKEPTINLDGFKSDSNVLVVGSSWPQEEAILTRLMEATDLKIVIAPHDISEARIESIVQLLNQFEPKRISKGYSDSDRLLILDSIGHLSTVYQYADFALVGGGFSGALHNILEPAVWGCHISYGPNTEKFPEAQDFVNQGFAMKIENEEDWTNTISELNADPEKLKAVQQKSIEFVESNTGATATVLSSIMT